MEYLESAKEDPEGGCVFCGMLDRPDDDPEVWILTRSPLAFVTLAKYPYNPGHLLVLPSQAANAAILERLGAKSDTRVLESLANSTKSNPIRLFESLSGKAKEFEALSATATLICCR